MILGPIGTFVLHIMPNIERGLCPGNRSNSKVQLLFHFVITGSQAIANMTVSIEKREAIFLSSYLPYRKKNNVWKDRALPPSVLELARILLNRQALSAHTLPQSSIASPSWKRQWGYFFFSFFLFVWTTRCGKDKQKQKIMLPMDGFAIYRFHIIHHLIFYNLSIRTHRLPLTLSISNAVKALC